jgi:hypothetical protein
MVKIDTNNCNTIEPMDITSIINRNPIWMKYVNLANSFEIVNSYADTHIKLHKLPYCYKKLPLTNKQKKARIKNKRGRKHNKLCTH